MTPDLPPEAVERPTIDEAGCCSLCLGFHCYCAVIFDLQAENHSLSARLGEAIERLEARSKMEKDHLERAEAAERLRDEAVALLRQALADDLEVFGARDFLAAYDAQEPR